MRYAPPAGAFASLGEAIAWTERRWGQQRPVPIRLHAAHATDGALGGPRYTGAFLAAISGSPGATEEVTERTACAHPGRSEGDRMVGRLCAMCVIHDAEGRPIAETGIYERQIERFRYPMSLALSQLANALGHRRGLPHPVVCVRTLAEHGWDAHATARSLDLGWDLAEAMFLRSLRQLHARYQERPSPRSVSWISKSEAQQRAEGLPAA